MKILILGLSRSGTSALAFKVFHSLPEEDTCFLFEPPKYGGSEKAHVVAKVLMDGFLWGLFPHEGHVIPPAAIDLDCYAEFDKRLLIVRDPKDRAISLQLYRLYHEPYCTDEPFLQSVLQFLRQKERTPDATRFIDFFEFIEGYRRYSGKRTPVLPRFQWPPEAIGPTNEDQLTTYLENQLGYFTVYYEDLIDGNLAPLEQYLGVRLTGPARIDPSMTRIARTKAHGSFRDWFTAEDLPYFKFLYKEFVGRFPRYDDWTLNGSKTILPEHASGYVARIVNEARANLHLEPILF